jgi:hypothetical protein
MKRLKTSYLKLLVMLLLVIIIINATPEEIFRIA